MDTLSQKLPNNPALWDKVILNALAMKVPKVAGSIMAIDVKESDYQGGNMTGLIVAANGALLVPLVVRNFRLKPFDVALYENKVVALTERTADSVLFSPEITNKKLVNYQDIQTYKDISQILSPPNTGYGSVNGMYATNKIASAKISLLEAIKISNDETKVKFASELLRSKDVLAAVAGLLPYKEILTELENVGKQKSASVKQGQAVYIKSFGKSYEVNGVMNGVIKSAEEISDLLDEAQKSELLLTGETLVGPSEDSDVEITILTNKGVAPLNKCTTASAVCADGSTMNGIFIPNITTFDGESTDKGMFLTMNKEWIYQENIIGNEIAGSCCELGTHTEPTYLSQHVNNITKMEGYPRIGDYGVFLNDFKRCATEPFKVVSVYNVAGTTLMSIATSSGQRLVVEYKKEYSAECPLRIVSGRLVSKYFPTDRVYAISNPYKYISLKGKKDGVRTPEEAVRKSVDISSPDKLVISIKQALDGGYVIKKSDYHADRGEQHLSKYVDCSKLGCQYELIRHGLGLKQAAMLMRMSPISFVLNKSATELATRHNGAELEAIPQVAPRRLLSNGTEQGSTQMTDNGYAQTANDLQDPDMLNILLTIGMSKMDDRVRSYVLSNIDDIQETIDKLGRLLLIVRTSEEEGVSEDVLSDVIQKLDKTIWELNDYFRQNQNVSEEG